MQSNVYIYEFNPMGGFLYTPSFRDTMICVIFNIKFLADVKPTCSWFHVWKHIYSVKLIGFLQQIRFVHLTKFN